MPAEDRSLPWGVRGIARAVADGEVTPTDVAEDVLARIDATEEKLQAFSQLDVDLVRAQAATLTEEAAGGRRRGPLHGVPVAIKEWFDVEGFPTLVKGPGATPEPEDATLVARLRAAGALIVGKTHTPIVDQAPPTRNPWNLEHSPGGSSSGSAAAVAARVVAVAIGEQTGGSNIRPAAFCGVGAIKPTYGLISRAGLHTGTWARDTAGVIGLDMPDMALVLSVIAGYDPRDPTSIERPAPAADLDVERIRPPRIGVVRNFFPALTEPVMLDAIDRSAEQFRAAGAEVVDVRLPEEFGAVWDAIQLQTPEGVTLAAPRRALDGPVTLADLKRGTAAVTASSRRAGELIPATYYLQARRVRAWVGQLVAAQLRDQQLDALLMAAAPGTAPKGLSSTGNPELLIPWSFLGFPAATVSAGLAEDGLPLGLQLVATARQDHALMRVGHWCEQTLGLLPAPPTSAQPLP